MVYLGIQNETYQESALDGKEMAIFEEEWKMLFMPEWSLERRLINMRKNAVLAGLKVAKNTLDEKSFGGFNAGANEIGISMIRPGHVGLARASGVTASEGDNTWVWTSGNAVKPTYAVGFENWIHSPTTATTAYSVPEDMFIMPLYFVEQSVSPKIQTIKMDIGRQDILYYDVSANQIRDNANKVSICPLPTTFWLPEMDVLIALQANCLGALEVRLGGFTIATGAMLNASCYDGSTNTVITRITAGA